MPGIDDYEAALTSYGIPFVDERVNGGHEWYVWRQNLYDYASMMAFRHTTTALSQVAGPGSSKQRAVVFIQATVTADTTEPNWPTGKVQFYLDGQKVEPGAAASSRWHGKAEPDATRCRTTHRDSRVQRR